MKRTIIIAVLLFAGYAFAQQGLWKVFDLETPEGSTTFGLLSTTPDTSAVFELFPYMTADVWAADTTADDSVDFKLEFQVCLDTALSNLPLEWKTDRTLTTSFTAESTLVRYTITDQPIGNGKHGRYVLTPGGDNSKSDASIARIIHAGYTYTRAR